MPPALCATSICDDFSLHYPGLHERGLEAVAFFHLDWLRSMQHGFWGGMAWHMAKMPPGFLIGPDGRIVQAHMVATWGITCR